MWLPNFSILNSGRDLSWRFSEGLTIERLAVPVRQGEMTVINTEGWRLDTHGKIYESRKLVSVIRVQIPSSLRKD